ADEDAAADDEGRRLARPEAIAPAHPAGVGVVRDDLALEFARRPARVARPRVEERLDDEPPGDRRRGRCAPPLVRAPDLLAGLRVDGEGDAAKVGDVEASVGDRGRELAQRARAEAPDDAERG